MFEIPNWNLKRLIRMADNTHKRIETAIVTIDQVERKIYSIRGQKVMLDSDLAALYGVETKALTRSTSRNIDRFPEDFRFQLTVEEFEGLRCQIGTSNEGRGGRRYMPYVFTEQGVAMLSSVLNSNRAVQVNIAIMRAFVNMRRLVATNEEISKKLAAIERKLGDHDENFNEVFAAIREMMAPDRQPKQIGYIQKKKS